VLLVDGDGRLSEFLTVVWEDDAVVVDGFCFQVQVSFLWGGFSVKTGIVQ
jgi:hypothetical protein